MMVIGVITHFGKIQQPMVLIHIIMDIICLTSTLIKPQDQKQIPMLKPEFIMIMPL